MSDILLEFDIDAAVHWVVLKYELECIKAIQNKFTPTSNEARAVATIVAFLEGRLAKIEEENE